MKQSKKSGSKQLTTIGSASCGTRAAPDPIFTLSAKEQARVPALADVVLHAGTSHEGPAHAGDPARREHERLKQELREVVEGFERKRRSGGTDSDSGL